MDIAALLTQSISASLLCLAVWGLAPMVRNVTLRHILWLIVLAKFVAPTTLEIGLLPHRMEPASTSSGTRPSGDQLREVTADEKTVELGTVVSTRPNIEKPASLSYANLPWQLPATMIVWAGAVLIVATTAARINRFRHLLRLSDEPPPELRRRLNKLSQQLGLRRPPRLRLLAANISPAVWPFGLSPTIVMPRRLLQESAPVSIDSLLNHELAHIRRHDHWVRCLEVAVTCLHWWNPLVWLARGKLREAEETCCDACVVRAMSNQRATYARTLVAAAGGALRRDAIPLSHLALEASDTRFLRRRIECIMNDSISVPLNLPWKVVMTALATVLLSCGLSTAEAPGAVEEQPTSGLPILGRIDVLERRFILGQNGYRHGLENYQQSLQNYKRSGDTFDPDAAVYRNILAAYRNGMQAYANGLETHRQQIEKQRQLRQKLDQALLFWRRATLDRNTLRQGHLLAEVQRVANEYLDFLSPQIYYGAGNQRYATAGANGTAHISSGGPRSIGRQMPARPVHR